MAESSYNRGDRILELVGAMSSHLSVGVGVLAVWLGGSLGRRSGDRYSDIDVYYLVRDEQFDTMSSEVPRILEQVSACVLVEPMAFVRGGWSCKTSDWVHIDVVPVALTVVRPLVGVQVLYDPEDRLRLAARSSESPSPFYPRDLVISGLHLLGGLPSLVGRGEFVAGQANHATLRDQVLAPLVLAEIGEQPLGLKHLRRRLGEDRYQLLARLETPRADRESLVRCHEELGRRIVEQGQRLASLTSAVWPARAVEALSNYWQRELGVALR